MSIPKFWVTLKVDVWVRFDRGLWGFVGLWIYSSRLERDDSKFF